MEVPGSVQEILALALNLVVHPWENHDLASLVEGTRGRLEVQAVEQKKACPGEDSLCLASSNLDLESH
jgi:hypothetical protein